MAARRSQRERQESPQKQRRSLRLENKKNVPLAYKRSLAYQSCTTSKTADCLTPRTLFKKVLQTLPVSSPVVHVKCDTSKPAEPVLQLPSEHTPFSDIEISLSEPASKKMCRISLIKNKSKKICLSEFESGLNKQFDPNTVHSSLENTSQTKSLQISFKTPAPLPIPEKKGLIRRPNNYRGINVKDFEGGIQQNLLNIHESPQSSLLALQAATFLSGNAELTTADTELFTQPLPPEQNGEECSDAHSQNIAARESLTGEHMVLSNHILLPTNEKSGADLEVSEHGHKEVLESETKFADVPESLPEEKFDGPAEEEPKKLQGTVEELGHTGDAGEMEAIPQEHSFTLRNEEQENRHGNSNVAQLLSLPEESLSTEMCPVRSSTPVDAKLSKLCPGHLSPLLKEKSAEHSVKEMVAQIIEELDKSVIPAFTGQGILETDLNQEPSENTIHVLQNYRATTPGRNVSRKNPDQLKTPPTKTTEKITQQFAVHDNINEVLHMEAESNMISEAKMDPESEEMSEAETDLENAEPTGKTPAFVHVRAFHCTPLLSTPQAQKMAVSRSSYMPSSVKRTPKPAKRGQNHKHDKGLSSSFIKKCFNHYVRMPVAKDAFKAVESCVDVFFKRLCNDLEAYSNHAGRKTIEPADVELLMRRQGLITDKMPLNVLIENHLPLEYRKLLIPVATAGNKVVPSKPLWDTGNAS